MKRFAIIGVSALLGACATGAPMEPIDPVVLARASCIHQIQLPENFDLNSVEASSAAGGELFRVYAKVRECLALK